MKLGKTRRRGGIDKVVAVSLCQHSPEIAQLMSGRRVEGHEQCSDLITSARVKASVTLPTQISKLEYSAFKAGEYKFLFMF